MVNIGNMMKQAQQMQKKMTEVQEKLNSIEVEGSSGGGMVKVISTAKGETAAQEAMKNVTGGISLPPGMKLPF